MIIFRGLSFLEHGFISRDSFMQAFWCAIILFVVTLPYFIMNGVWALRALWKNEYTNMPENVICLNCQNVFTYDIVKSATCPKCDGRLENLESFYERHPDLSKKKYQRIMLTMITSGSRPTRKKRASHPRVVSINGGLSEKHQNVTDSYHRSLVIFLCLQFHV
jgi:hypothetical protein